MHTYFLGILTAFEIELRIEIKDSQWSKNLGKNYK